MRSLSNSPGAQGSWSTCLFPPSWFLPPTAQNLLDCPLGANSQDPGPPPGPMENAECLEDSALEAFRTLPDSHKMLPRGLQALPRAPKMLADRSKSHQQASKWPPGGLQVASRPQNSLKKLFKKKSRIFIKSHVGSSHAASQVPGPLRDRSRGLWGVQMGLQDSPEEPPRASKAPQEASSKPQDATRSPPRSLQHAARKP